MNDIIQEIVNDWILGQEIKFLNYPATSCDDELSTADSEPIYNEDEPLDFSEGNNND